MTYEYGPWAEYTGENLGDAMVQAQMRHMSRVEAEKFEPLKASSWDWGECGSCTIHAYRKVLVPRVEVLCIYVRDGRIHLGTGYEVDDKNFALDIPLTQSGKLDFSRQPTWRELK